MKTRQNTAKTAYDQVKWGRIIIILAIAVVVGVAATLIRFFNKEENKQSVSCTMTLTWNGASEGLAPNGEQFDLLNIDRKPILASAIEKSGLKVDVNTVDDNLVITGAYPKKMLESLVSEKSVLDIGVSEVNVEEYHPTNYGFTLYCNLGVSNEETYRLMQCITDSYREYMKDRYLLSWTDVTISSVLDVAELDYPDALEVLKYEVKTLAGAAERYQTMAPNFTYKGQAFSSIAANAEKLLTNEITIAESVVHGSNLSRDKAKLTEKYKYIVRSNQLELAQTEEALASIQTLINGYHRDNSLYITSADGVSMVGGNSSATYSELVAKQVELSEQKAKLEADIAYYDGIVATLNQSDNSTSSYKSACEQMDLDVAAIVAKEKQLESSLQEFIDAYNKERASSETIAVKSLKINQPEILSTAFIVALIKGCGPFGMIAMIAILAMELYRRIKKDQMEKA